MNNENNIYYDLPTITSHAELFDEITLKLLPNIKKVPKILLNTVEQIIMAFQPEIEKDQKWLEPLVALYFHGIRKKRYVHWLSNLLEAKEDKLTATAIRFLLMSALNNVEPKGGIVSWELVHRVTKNNTSKLKGSLYLMAHCNIGLSKQQVKEITSEKDEEKKENIGYIWGRTYYTKDKFGIIPIPESLNSHDILKVFEILCIQYGFENPKTQAIYKMIQEKNKNWSQMSESLAKNINFIHRQVCGILTDLCIEFQNEKYVCPYIIDIYLPEKEKYLEILGPGHFCAGGDHMNGKTVMRQRVCQAMGLEVRTVAYQQFYLKSKAKSRQYKTELIQNILSA